LPQQGFLLAWFLWGQISVLEFWCPKRQRLITQQNVIRLTTGDLKQIPDANRIGPSSAGLTHKARSCQNEDGSRARSAPSGQGSSARSQSSDSKALSLLPNPGKRDIKGRTHLPQDPSWEAKGKQSLWSADGEGRARHAPGQGWLEEGDGPEGSTLLRA